MSTNVDVFAGDFRQVTYHIRQTQTAVASWGMLTYDSRERIRKATDAALDACRGIASMSGTVTVTAAKVRACVALLENLTTAVHSARKVMTVDRRRALGTIAAAKRLLVSYIQLRLFEHNQ